MTTNDAKPNLCDIRDVMVKSLVNGVGVSKDVASLARAVKALADKAWDDSSAASLRGDNATAEYARGRAHAFCQVLGDQEGLWYLIEQAEARDD